MPNRYYPQFAKDVHPQVVEEDRYLRDALYDLRDRLKSGFDYVQVTLHANYVVKPPLTAGKPIVMILMQDGTGGWLISFDPTIRGTNVLIPVTTLNTYTAFILWPVSEKLAYLVSFVTGATA